MMRFRSSLKSGAWLTLARLRGYSLIVLTLGAAAVIGWIALSSDAIDRNGKPLGTDFSNVYAAGVLLHEGKASDAYVPELQHRAEMAVFGDRDVPFYGWHYPPFFFAVAAAVACLPYLGGLMVWLLASGAAYLAMLRAILPTPLTLLVAAAFPAAMINIGHGQNGFLTAALLGAALQCLDRRPWIAGVLIGLLAYKPQFGILIPFCLLAGRRWQTIAAAAATVAALILLTTAALGFDIWHAFRDSMTFTQSVVLEAGGTGWEKIQSVFAATRALGATVPQAYAAQLALGLALAASSMWLWASRAPFDLKASALATASLLATPYVLDYDLVVLAVSIAFFVRHGLARGFASFEITLLAAAWCVPLLARSVAAASLVPLGFVIMLTLYCLTLRRAVHELRGTADRRQVVGEQSSLVRAHGS